MLRGYVDRLDRNAAGDTRVVDYKTGKAPGEGFEQKALFQMRFYALAWWRMTGEVPRRLQLMYLGNSEVLRYEPVEDDLRSTERRGPTKARVTLSCQCCEKARAAKLPRQCVALPNRSAAMRGSTA